MPTARASSVRSTDIDWGFSFRDAVHLPSEATNASRRSLHVDFGWAGSHSVDAIMIAAGNTAFRTKGYWTEDCWAP